MSTLPTAAVSLHARKHPQRSRLLTLAKVAAASLLVEPASAQSNVDGVWSPLYNWPLIRSTPS